MKRKGYTSSHDNNLLREIDNNGGQFTSEEKTYIMKKEHGGSKGRFSSKSQLLRDLPRYTLGPRLSLLQEYIELNNYTSILSMGAGSCVQEYLLKMVLPENTKIYIIGLGYGGPLAVAFAEKFQVIRFDNSHYHPQI